MIYDIPFAIVLPDQPLPVVFTAVSHHHALAIYLEVLPDLKSVKGKKFEVYEWLKPFTSRKIIAVKGSFLFAIKMRHLSDEAKIDYVVNKVF